MSMSMPFALRGTFIHSTAFGTVEVLQEIVCVVSGRRSGGKILAIVPAEKADAKMAELGLEIAIHQIPEGRFMCPGFIDIHVHAPQYSYAGTATDRPLMQWLDHYTFPREAQMQRLISNGTTTTLMFGSLHLEPTQLLADIVHKAGLRAYLGKVCMDRNSQGYYVHSLEQNLADTEAFLNHVRGLETALVHPVITPRFVPSCSPALLQGLGNQARQHGCHVQSHISESLDNDSFVSKLHPEVNGRDTQLYEQAGLLTQRSIMAHGVTLTDDELALLAKRGTAIAHCPLSNFYFADIPLDTLRCLHAGVKVGLGTDMAGGYSPSMLSAMRSAVITSKTVRMMHIDAERRSACSNSDALDALAPGQRTHTSGGSFSAGAVQTDGCPDSLPGRHSHTEQGGDGSSEQKAASADSAAARRTLTFKEAFWLATMGGADALGLQDTVGSFEVGKEFDAIMVNTDHGGSFDVFPTDSILDRFEKFVNLGDDRNIRAVWIQGGLVTWK